MSYPPLLENKTKSNFKKFNGEKILILHILSELDIFSLIAVGFVKIILPSGLMRKNVIYP